LYDHRVAGTGEQTVRPATAADVVPLATVMARAFYVAAAVSRSEPGVLTSKTASPPCSSRPALFWAKSYRQPELERSSQTLQHRDRRGCASGLEPRDPGLGHPCSFCELPLGQTQFLAAAAHRLRELKPQPGLLVRLGCRWTSHPGCPRLGQSCPLLR
jgi:hypothetical protein